MVDDGEGARAEWVRELLVRDVEAGFVELVREYRGLIHALLRRAGRHDAEDLAGEVFVRAYGALLGYAPAKVRGLRLRAWLVTIAVNLCRNEARGRQRAPAVVGLEEVVEPRCQWDAFDDVVERLDLRAWLARLTALLPKHQRMAVVLRHGCGLSIGEVSAAMGCAESTARSYASRGLARLRELVAEQGVERGFGEAQAA